MWRLIRERVFTTLQVFVSVSPPLVDFSSVIIPHRHKLLEENTTCFMLLMVSFNCRMAAVKAERRSASVTVSL